MSDYALLSAAAVVIYDGNGRVIDTPGVELTYNSASADTGAARANLLFRLPLGALGDTTVYVDIPPAEILAWAEAIRGTA